VFLRDSKDATGEDFPHLHFPLAEWDGGRGVVFSEIPAASVPPYIVKARNAKIRQDLLSMSPADWAHRVSQRGSWYAVTRDDELTVLYFDQPEVDAWLAGVAASEFAFEEVAA
jgi:hypothetical protein